MLRMNWRFVFLFAGLVLVQVLILNNMMLGGYANPQLYILFVLMLPVNVPGWLLLASSFVLGLILDAFSDSMAIHAAATVFMAFCRPAMIRFVTGNTVMQGQEVPSFSVFGGFSLILYALALILLHHAVLFFLEIFHFAEFVQTLSRIVISAGLTLVFAIIGFALLERSFSN